MMPTLEQALETFLDEQRARLNSKKTIRDYAEKIGIWLAFAGETTLLETVTTQDMRKYVGHCRDRGLARETIRSYITALKVAWAFWSDEYSIDDAMKRIKKPIRKQGKPKSIKPKDFIAVFEAAKGRHRIDWRNRAMLAVLADTGVRRGELLTMTTEIDVITRRCAVDGKTGERTIFWAHG
ncbi:MAG: site-specific integrase [Chloroflexota bacterium]